MDMKVINEMFREIAEYRLLEEQAKAEREAREAEIKAMMSEAGVETLIGDEHKATYKSIVSNRFDSTAFKKDYADMYKEYQKPTSSMRFTFA